MNEVYRDGKSIAELYIDDAYDLFFHYDGTPQTAEEEEWKDYVDLNDDCEW